MFAVGDFIAAGAGGERGRSDAAFRPGDLGRYFRGSWAFLRLLRDAATGRDGSIIGRADFASEEGGLRYRERGRMVFAGHRGLAERAYRFRLTGPGRAEVLFADGRFFHALDLTRGIDGVEHLCGDDLYRGRYALEDAQRWALRWRVRGPGKDLLLTTRYLRFGSAAART